jgi:hypothetical protein
MRWFFMCLTFGVLAGCSSSSVPETVASGGGTVSGGSSPEGRPCNGGTYDAGSGVFNFDANPDVGLGIGTVNPTTPADGAAAFNGDATVSPYDAGVTNPCP